MFFLALPHPTGTNIMRWVPYFMPGLDAQFFTVQSYMHIFVAFEHIFAFASFTSSVKEMLDQE